MEAGEGEAPSLVEPALELLMPQHNDLSRTLLTLDQASTLIAVIEVSQSSWLVAAIVPGIARHPLKKINPDETILLGLLRRWQDEAAKAGRTITRIAVAYEAGRDGFWLARWLRARGIEASVIHPTSIPVSREHRRAKTDRLDTELLKRVRSGVTPVTALAERKNACAAAMSRCSLNSTSTNAPERSMARYK